MIIYSFRYFAFFALCCFHASASVLPSVASAQEVEQGGSGSGAEGDANEAAKAYDLGILFDKSGDHASAFIWFSVATELGHTGAIYRKGRAYAEGRGVTRDDKLAVPLFEEAVKAKHTGAMNSLGLLYFAGRGGLLKSSGKAEELFRNAAQHGNAQAMYNLGNLYARGSGDTQPDLAMAYVLLELASQQGVQEAESLGQRLEGSLSLAQRTQINALRAQWKNSIEANK